MSVRKREIIISIGHYQSGIDNSQLEINLRKIYLRRMIRVSKSCNDITKSMEKTSIVRF